MLKDKNRVFSKEYNEIEDTIVLFVCLMNLTKKKMSLILFLMLNLKGQKKKKNTLSSVSLYHYPHSFFVIFSLNISLNMV